MNFTLFQNLYLRIAFCLAVTATGVFISAQPVFASGPHQKMLSIYNVYQGMMRVPEEQPVSPLIPRVQFTAKYTLTAYTSLAALTDSSPFITASGSRVHLGTVAANCLPFGTRIQIPALFGDDILVVEDRLHPRKGCGMIDVWLPTYNEAKRFGVKRIEVKVLK